MKDGGLSYIAEELSRRVNVTVELLVEDPFSSVKITVYV
jgi:hypothetical protein